MTTGTPAAKPADTLSPQQLAFRNAMAHLPAAVCIITTDGDAGRCGITASAVCSVTDSPPTVLVCLNQRSAMHDVFKANGKLCINVLSGAHEEQAMHFSGATKMAMADRFELDGWARGTSSQPVLKDALVRLEGKIKESKSVGSHSVFFVELEDIDVSEERDSLIYFNRLFHTVQRTRPEA